MRSRRKYEKRKKRFKKGVQSENKPRFKNFNLVNDPEDKGLPDRESQERGRDEGEIRDGTPIYLENEEHRRERRVYTQVTMPMSWKNTLIEELYKRMAQDGVKMHLSDLILEALDEKFGIESVDPIGAIELPDSWVKALQYIAEERSKEVDYEITPGDLIVEAVKSQFDLEYKKRRRSRRPGRSRTGPNLGERSIGSLYKDSD